LGRPASPLAAGAGGVGHDGDDSLETERLGEHQINPLSRSRTGSTRRPQPVMSTTGVSARRLLTERATSSPEHSEAGSSLVGELARSYFDAHPVVRKTSAGSVDAEEAGRTVSRRSTRPYLPASERM
jgi:hypothetical protein